MRCSRSLTVCSATCLKKVTDPKTAANVDLNDIRLVKKLGATTDDTELVEGLVLTQKVSGSHGRRHPKAELRSRVAGGPSRIQVGDTKKAASCGTPAVVSKCDSCVASRAGCEDWPHPVLLVSTKD